MATLTIRNLPDELHAALKERARRNRRSLNQEVIAELIGTTREEVLEDEERKRRRSEKLIAMVTEMREGVTRILMDEEIDAAVEVGRA